MTQEDTKQGSESSPNPHLKEQDKGIIEVFAREDHHVLTNSEIADQVSVSPRTVRRRIDALADQGIIGKRVVSGVKLAWLEEEVKEPITVQYPLLRYVRDHTSVQLFLLGVASGIVAVLILLSAALTIGYSISIGFLTNKELLVYGVGAATISALFIIMAVLFALIEWVWRGLGIDLKSVTESKE